MSGVEEVVCEGWLRKSPPEKKLRRYAWKKRWFVLRSGRLSGEPDVLQYYKNQQSRRPIRTINLNLCEQVDAGLSFTKKELEGTFVFDLKTEERTWYLVAESEEDMNRWVSSICLLCGFNQTDEERLPVSSSGPAATRTSDTIVMATGSLPVPYDPVRVRNKESEGNGEDDYLWLSHCQSQLSLPPPSLGSRTAPWTISCMTGPLSQSLDASMTPDPKKGAGRPRCHPSPHPRKHSLDFHLRPVAISLTDDAFALLHPHAHKYTNSGYQVPRPASTPQPQAPRRPSSTPSVDSLELHASTPTPPPRPPKPSAFAAQVENSAVAMLPRATSETGGKDGCVEGGRGGLPRSSTIASPGHSQTGCEAFSIPRSLSDRASMFEFSESFNSYFFNKGMVPLGSVCSEDDDVDENYVPMSAATTEPPVAPRVPPAASSEPSIQDANYVPMTPLPAAGEHASLGRQVPPPAHMGFRNSPLTPVAPLTPPLRRNSVNTTSGSEVEATPPPIHRNLKPQRKGVLVSQPAGRSDIQTVDEPKQKTKVKPAPLDISSVQDWQEVPPPVRSPVTRTFTRGPSCRQSARPTSAHSSSPSSDSDDPDESYVAMTTSNLSFSAGEASLRIMLHRASDGGISCSPLLPRARDKPVEYLDLDLHTGRSTPPRQKRCTAEGGSSGNDGVGSGEERVQGSRTRVDYVVVDPKRTKALRNTREAWHDGRMSTEKEKF